MRGGKTRVSCGRCPVGVLGGDRGAQEGLFRGFGAAGGQTAAELDELFGTAKSCKNMRNVGFDELAATGGELKVAGRAGVGRGRKLRDPPDKGARPVLGAAPNHPPQTPRRPLGRPPTRFGTYY